MTVKRVIWPSRNKRALSQISHHKTNEQGWHTLHSAIKCASRSSGVVLALSRALASNEQRPGGKEMENASPSKFHGRRMEAAVRLMEAKGRPTVSFQAAIACKSKLYERNASSMKFACSCSLNPTPSQTLTKQHALVETDLSDAFRLQDALRQLTRQFR